MRGKNNPDKPQWKNYLREIGLNGFEVVQHTGGPVFIYNRGEPHTLKNVVLCILLTQ
jgi:hypothetical protein